MKVTDQQILNVLGTESLAWNGGQTTVHLATRLGISESAMRRRLSRLEQAKLCYALAPSRRNQGLSGQGKSPLLWYRGKSDL